MTARFRLDKIIEKRPPWPTIGIAGAAALLLLAPVARLFEPHLAKPLALGVAAFILLTVYFTAIVRLAGAPWGLAFQIAPLYAFGIASIFSLLAVIDF